MGAHWRGCFVAVLMVLMAMTGSVLADPKPGASVVVSPSCQQKLKQLGVPVAIPRYLPAGYHLSRCEVNPKSEYNEYELTFRKASPNKAQESNLQIIATKAEGLGDISIGDVHEAPAPTGFKGTIYIGYDDTEYAEPRPANAPKRLVTQWITDKNEKQAFRLESTRGLSLEDGLRVMKSLYLLPKNTAR